MNRYNQGMKNIDTFHLLPWPWVKILIFSGLFFGVFSIQWAVPPSRTLHDLLAPPSGYTLSDFQVGSFSHYIQHLPLKQDGIILNYTGQPAAVAAFHVLAVVDMPLLFRSDLEQCADQCMRFWAEYHQAEHKLKQFHLFNYSGQRLSFSTSGRSYRDFLRQAFAFSNSHSLKRGCRTITSDQLQPGDMIVQNDTGGIGHVSMIVNMCRSPRGEPLYLIGFGFIPAQQFHVEKALAGYGEGGWFTLDGFFRYLHDAFDYGQPVLRRFE